MLKTHLARHGLFGHGLTRCLRQVRDLAARGANLNESTSRRLFGAYRRDNELSEIASSFVGQEVTTVGRQLGYSFESSPAAPQIGAPRLPPPAALKKKPASTTPAPAPHPGTPCPRAGHADGTRPWTPTWGTAPQACAHARGRAATKFEPTDLSHA